MSGMDRTHSVEDLDRYASRKFRSCALIKPSDINCPKNTDHNTNPHISEESSPETLTATNPLEVEVQCQGELGNVISDNETEHKQEEVNTDVKVKPKKVRQRRWTVLLSTIVACIPFVLAGCTLGFPSGALLDLINLEDRPGYKLSTELADVFGVRRKHILCTMSCVYTGNFIWISLCTNVF